MDTRGGASTQADERRRPELGRNCKGMETTQPRVSMNNTDPNKQTFPTRTEGSVKKHWYKDMHYAEFAEDEVRWALHTSLDYQYCKANLPTMSQSQALMSAIKEYENNKWKVIGQKVGKPAKVGFPQRKKKWSLSSTMRLTRSRRLANNMPKNTFQV